MARPKKYDDDLRDALIEAAATQIVAGGVDSVALRPLAATQGSSTTAIYSLFGGRAGLVQAVVDRADESFAASQFASPQSDDVLIDLFELGLTYRRWALEHADLYQVMFVSNRAYCLPAPGALPDDDAAPRDRAIRPLLAAVGRAVESGVLVGETMTIALSMWAGVHGWVMLELRGLQLTEQQYRDHLKSLPTPWLGQPVNPDTDTSS